MPSADGCLADNVCNPLSYSSVLTGNANAFAVDFGVAGQRGDPLARAIAQKYGIRHIINVDGQRYSLQLLWKVEGHFNHVHFGIRRAD